jgi:predicted nucleic acid-binding protein
MVGNVLVDSSYFIELLRAGEDPFEDFANHADDVDFFTCGVVMIEVLRGVKVKKAHARLSGLMGAMIYVPTLNHLWERAAALAWDLDRRGQFIRVPDLIVAMSAMEADAALLTFDSDFRRVPGLRVIDRLD